MKSYIAISMAEPSPAAKPREKVNAFGRKIESHRARENCSAR